MLHLLIDGQAVAVTLRENPRARRMVLRFDRSGEGLIVTLPRRVSKERALEFARSHTDWVREKLKEKPARIAFAPGSLIPYLGAQIRITHVPGKRMAGKLEDGCLHIGGMAEHVARRTRDWLKAQARDRLTAASLEYATRMGVRYSRLSLRDTQSRWGSCSPDGVLSYSWRLIFTPAHVLEYVAAHEVAHLREMNHGPRFWALVEEHFPDYQAARHWLKQEGAHLHLIG